TRLLKFRRFYRKRDRLLLTPLAGETHVHPTNHRNGTCGDWTYRVALRWHHLDAAQDGSCWWTGRNHDDGASAPAPLADRRDHRVGWRYRVAAAVSATRLTSRRAFCAS